MTIPIDLSIAETMTLLLIDYTHGRVTMFKLSTKSSHCKDDHFVDMDLDCGCRLYTGESQYKIDMTIAELQSSLQYWINRIELYGEEPTPSQVKQELFHIATELECLAYQLIGR